MKNTFFATNALAILICLLAGCSTVSTIPLTEHDRADLQAERTILEQRSEQSSLLYRVFAGNPAEVADDVAEAGDYTLLGMMNGAGEKGPYGLDCNRSQPMETYISGKTPAPDAVRKSMLVYNLTMLDKLGFRARTGCRVSDEGKKAMRQWALLPFKS